MIKQLLNGEWILKLSGMDKSYSINIPGDNYLALIDADIIKDPFIGENEKECEWVMDKDIVIERMFDLQDDIFNMERIELSFKGIDTLATVYLNGEVILNSENVHIEYIIDIKNIAKRKNNRLVFEISSPKNYIEKKQNIDPMPKNMMGISGFPHIRKAACQFGWDWGPILPFSGISKDIVITGYKNKCSIKSVLQEQMFDNNICTISINVELDNIDQDCQLNVQVFDPNGVSISNKSILLDIDVNSYSQKVIIDNPSLWYACGMNNNELQPLYTIETSIIFNSSIIDSKSHKIGLRTIKLCTDNDQYGSDFAFIVNGVRVFSKGANWIPADSFISRLTDKKLEVLISSMARANMNMVRVWGGGYYESDSFYDLCDKYGIMVWQDFCFACAPYPFYDENLVNNLKKEIENVVKRLRHHASLALWCGNNEVEAMSMGWLSKKALIKCAGEFFYNTLPNELIKYDKITPYWPGSPSSGEYLKKVGSDDYGDTHLWQVWHGLMPFKYYRKRFTRFCSEFGFESLPDMNTIMSFAKEEDLNINSSVMLAHQKNMSGNSKILYYAMQNYVVPKRFDELVYISQIVQAESIKEAVEHWRRNKGRCNGALYWQYNDCWPVSSWSSIDYYGNWKALQYYCKEFFKPMFISLYEDKGTVNLVAINDTIYAKNYSIEYKLMDFNGAELYKNSIDCQLQANENKLFDNILLNCNKSINRRTQYVIASLSVDDKIITTQTVLLEKAKKVQLNKAKIDREVTFKNGELTVRLKCDTYVHRVFVHLSGCTEPFTDNFFDLMPNQEKIIKVQVPFSSYSECIEAMDIICYNNLVSKYSKVQQFFLKAKINLTPINFANRIIYKFM